MPWESSAEKSAETPSGSNSTPEQDPKAAKKVLGQTPSAKSETPPAPLVGSREASSPADARQDAEEDADEGAEKRVENAIEDVSEGEGPPRDAAASSPVPAAPAHPVVAIVRERLAKEADPKDADEADLAALTKFYQTYDGPPLWVTEMGFTAKGQAVLFEIGEAGDWGLETKDFALPDADALPADETAQALAEIKLNLAVLKYARFARGGRYVPSEISKMFDQNPSLREPGTVIAEIGTTGAPDIYLRSLHPAHPQFGRLQKALTEAREAEKPNDIDIKRLIINMERWRWMPEDLGALHVQLNTPEFMLYLVKEGETIYEDKTLVGTIRYATPIFSAELETVVFNPNWVAPPSVLRDKLWPALKRKSFNILKSNKLNVSYKGKPINPQKVDWSRVNIHSYTFSQKAGPKNVLGKAKFLYPNRHIVYMHDTLPSWDKTFKKETRSVGNACVRMENPRKFAEKVLAADQQLPQSKVKSLWDKGVNSRVKMDTKPPVHTTYFTVAVDEEGKVSKFKDLYGLDRKAAKAMFESTKGFPVPPPAPKERASRSVASSGTSSPSSGGGFSNSLDFFND